MNETDLQEFYELLDKKEAENKRETNHLLHKQVQILEDFLKLERMLREMYPWADGGEFGLLSQRIPNTRQP